MVGLEKFENDRVARLRSRNREDVRFEVMRDFDGVLVGVILPLPETRRDFGVGVNEDEADASNLSGSGFEEVRGSSTTSTMIGKAFGDGLPRLPVLKLLLRLLTDRGVDC